MARFSSEESNGPSPWDFPLGSIESRAAARIRLIQLNDRRERIRIIRSVPWHGEDNSRLNFGQWQESQDGTLTQIVYVPHVWAKPGEAIPTCPDCGTPFEKTKEYPGMIGFRADCMDKHDPELLANAGRG